MNWIETAQTFSTVLNIVVMLLVKWSSRSTKKKYEESDLFLRETMDIERRDFNFHIIRLSEEIRLLKTNDGLNSVRNIEDQYQMYLNLLRE